MDKKIGIIIQARLKSSRLPRKVLLDCGGQTLLERVMEKCEATLEGYPDAKIVVATTEPEIVTFCNERDINVFIDLQSDENDVLSRFVRCNEIYDLDIISRVTADCPLLHPAINKKVIDEVLNGADFASNVNNGTFYPGQRTFFKGLDFECFTKETLQKMDKNIQDIALREHVTLGVYKGLLPDITLKTVMCNLSIDTQEDLDLVSTIYRKDQEYSMDGYFKYWLKKK